MVKTFMVTPLNMSFMITVVFIVHSTFCHYFRHHFMVMAMSMFIMILYMIVRIMIRMTLPTVVRAMEITNI